MNHVNFVVAISEESAAVLSGIGFGACTLPEAKRMLKRCQIATKDGSPETLSIPYAIYAVKWKPHTVKLLDVAP